MLFQLIFYIAVISDQKYLFINSNLDMLKKQSKTDIEINIKLDDNKCATGYINNINK